MGQQQLLLLVLSVIVVGLAVVIGINLFGFNQVKANADAMFNEALRITFDIQAWAARPAMFGGPSTSETIASVTFDRLGYPHSGGTYSSPEGEYVLSTSLGADCDAPTIPSGKTALLYINVTNPATDNSICVAIAGRESSDIGTSARYGSGLVP